MRHTPHRAATCPDPAHPQPPLRYTPRHLAEKILTSKSALGDERKRATVLFADRKGSMECLGDSDSQGACTEADVRLGLAVRRITEDRTPMKAVNNGESSCCHKRERLKTNEMPSTQRCKAVEGCRAPALVLSC
jgi:hypothetical protein